MNIGMDGFKQQASFLNSAMGEVLPAHFLTYQIPGILLNSGKHYRVLVI